MNERNWVDENGPEIKGFILRNAVITVTHPLEYSKLLIQLGYEPFAPTVSTTFLLRKKYLGLPNVLTYLKYIKSVDGLIGCYRGLIPRLCYANVYYLVYNKVSENCPWQCSEESEGEREDSKSAARRRSTASSLSVPKCITDFIPSDIQAFIRTLSWDVIAVSVGTTASYPFHLMAVRSMGQFVGRETKFDSLWGSIVEIFQTEGLLGFFKGLFPRLISEVLTVIIAGTSVFVITKYISNKNQQLTNLGGSYIANAFAYQYYVVSNNMAVNNIGLVIGSPPFAKPYSSWYDCWGTLYRVGQLSRAANVVARKYTGRSEIMDGQLVPVGYPFGPVHPRGLGMLEKKAAAHNT